MYENDKPVTDEEMLNVQKMITLTFGDFDENVINFKMLQAIVHILAHRLNMLEQDVDIRLEERAEILAGLKKRMKDDALMATLISGDESGSDEFSSSDEEGGAIKYKKSRRSKKSKTPSDKSEGASSKRGKTRHDKEGKGKKHGKSSKDGETSSDSAASAEFDVDEETGKKIRRHKGDKSKGARSMDKSGGLGEDGHGRKRKKKTGEGEMTDDDESLDDDESAGTGKGKRKGRGRKAKGLLREDGTYEESKEGERSGSDIIRMGRRGSKDTFSSGGYRTTSRGSIELATRSQFELLASDVKRLMKKTKPVPTPSMPDNQTIKEALSKGTTTLSGSMEAMQLNARVKAAEQALTKMTELLSHLAAIGALPPDMAALIDQLQKEHEELLHLMVAGEKDVSRKGRHRRSMKPAGARLRSKSGEKLGEMVSTLTQMSSSMLEEDPLVTPVGLSEAIEEMKHEMWKNMSLITEKSTTAAEQVTELVKTVEKKLIRARGVNGRLSDLDVKATKHADELSGFDAGLTRQLEKFRTQLDLMQSNLKEGLENLNKANIKASVAVTDLKEGHYRMELLIHTTMHHIGTILVTHKSLSEESQGLHNWVDMIVEDKVDRLELEKGLQQKLDKNKLHGLLKEEAFEISRKELNKQLETCFELFAQKDVQWMSILKEHMLASASKAQLLDVYTLKDYATSYLENIKDTLQRLEQYMGDPEVARLTRMLSKNAYCASCLVPAQMHPFDKNYGKPPELPKLALVYFPRESDHDISLPRPEDERKYVCKRWVGGSHTIIGERKPCEKPRLSELQQTPIRHFAETAPDGHIYMMEEPIEPCAECKELGVPTESQHHTSTADVGSGDQEDKGCMCPEDDPSNMSLLNANFKQ